MVLQFESIISTSYMERRCFFKTFLCSKLLFLDVQRWVFFQETQTGQPSDNFPWFFDLNPSFERTASRVNAFTFSHLTLELFVVCFSGWIFFQKLKQANQATISHGSSTCLHPFDVLHRQKMFLLFFHSTDGVYFLLDVSLVLGDTPSYQNFQFEISLLWKCYFVQSL